MCHSHSCLSIAMWSPLMRFTSGIWRRVVLYSPVPSHLLTIVSVVSSGNSVFRLLTIAFLFVDSTPDLGLGFCTHAVINSFGGCWSGERAVLPRYVMVLAFSIVSASGMSWNIFLIRSFVIWSSITSVVVIPRIFLIARCQKTFSLSIWDCRNAHVSHPHNSRLAGIARKICFLACRSA